MAVRDLREQLQRVLIAAEYNASQLFTTIPIPRRSTLQRRAAALDFRSPITREPADFSLAQELDKLLHLFRAFLSRADEFVEFTGNSIRQDPVIELFVNDLEVGQTVLQRLSWFRLTYCTDMDSELIGIQQCVF